MSGIFDRMNHQPPVIDEPRLAPAFMCGVLMMSVANIRTGQELLTHINAALEPGPPLADEAMQDLMDIAGYIGDGTGEAGKVARLDRFCAMAGIWETGLAGITEAEARTMSGVTYTFGG